MSIDFEQSFAPLRSFSIVVLCGVAATAGCDSAEPKDSNSGGTAGSAGSANVSGAAGNAGNAGNAGSASGSGGQGGSAGAAGAAGGSAGNAGGAGSGATAGSAGTASGASGAGGGGGSGASGAGAGGASGDAGAAGGSGDACATALFCDDFEGGTTGSTPEGWTLPSMSGGATLGLDGEHFVSGAQSVKVTVPSGDGGAMMALTGAPVFPLSGNAFYGRMMVFWETAPETAVHWTIVEGRGLVPSQTYHAAYRLGGQHPVTDNGAFVGSQVMLNYETPDSYGGNGPSSDCWRHANRHVLPTGVWSCVEWHFDGPSNGMTFWIDGEEVVSVTETGDGCVAQSATYPWTAPDFDELRVGYEAYQADGARTFYIDDVALASGRIGCP
jgi:hypothetical protein